MPLTVGLGVDRFLASENRYMKVRPSRRSIRCDTVDVILELRSITIYVEKKPCFMLHYGGATPVVGCRSACSGPQWPIIRAMCEIPILVWVIKIMCGAVNKCCQGQRRQREFKWRMCSADHGTHAGYVSLRVSPNRSSLGSNGPNADIHGLPVRFLLLIDPRTFTLHG